MVFIALLPRMPAYMATTDCAQNGVCETGQECPTPHVQHLLYQLDAPLHTYGTAYAVPCNASAMAEFELSLWCAGRNAKLCMMNFMRSSGLLKRSTGDCYGLAAICNLCTPA